MNSPMMLKYIFFITWKGFLWHTAGYLCYKGIELAPQSNWRFHNYVSRAARCVASQIFAVICLMLVSYRTLHNPNSKEEIKKQAIFYCIYPNLYHSYSICDQTVARPAISLTTLALTGPLNTSVNPVQMPQILFFWYSSLNDGQKWQPPSATYQEGE